jgi:hypothetical protein
MVEQTASSRAAALTGERQTVELLYPPEAIERYFRHGNGQQQVAHFVRSVEAANAFLVGYPEASLLPGKKRPRGLAGALQYYKDETFLTLYAFASLDLLGRREHLAERERLFTELLRLALPELSWQATEPALELEKQVSPPPAYLRLLAGRFREDPACHPVWYLRVLGARSHSHEGATHSDAMLGFSGGRSVMFEAKFLSDISVSTTYAVDRNQLTRNLEAGLASVAGDLDRFAYVFVTPKAFRDRPDSRFYGYKLSEYMDPEQGPDALRRDLEHLEGEVDFEALPRHIGWVTWQELCGLLEGSEVFNSRAFPHDGVRAFFEERCLWPRPEGWPG